MSTKNPVTLAADLYKIRDTVKTLLGDQYKPTMTMLATTLMQSAKCGPEDILSAAIAAVKVCKPDPMQSLMTLACAVETLEPSA